MNGNRKTASLLIISFLFLVWFVGSIGLSIYEVKIGKTWLFLIILGQFFSIMGLISIISAVSEKQHGWWFGGIFILIGICCIIYGLMNKFGPDDVNYKMVNAIPLIIGVTMSIVSCILLIYGSIFRKNLQAECTYEISAKCIDFRVRGAGYKAVKCPIYEAFYNGERILFEKNIYSRGLGNPAKDEVRRLLVCLNDINKTTDPNSSVKEGTRISRYIDEKTDKAASRFSNILYASFLIGGCILAVAAYIFIPIF